MESFMCFNLTFYCSSCYYIQILYCGKSSSLGIKQGGLRSGKWAELPVTKSPKVVHFAIGHEGLHTVLLTEDGTVFFAGTARRGEDGDQSEYNLNHFLLCL
jgi:E3 ubiquitin-protein ligase MYCBP2